jgi:HAD superfamily phosphatase (TIGR01668 family)
MIRVKSILEVNEALLIETAGQKPTLLLDIDNTVLSPLADAVSSEVIEHVRKLAEVATVLLCTNNMTSRQRDAANQLNLPVLMQAMKPLTSKVMTYLEQQGLSTAGVIVIGDQWVTDGLLAHRLKCPLILVEPMAADRHALTRLLRRLEKRWSR